MSGTAKKTILATIAALALPSGGCTMHATPVQAIFRPPGHVVVLKAGHRHSARCGHYRHAGHWYLLEGHVHGPRCGHDLVAGVWVLKH